MWLARELGKPIGRSKSRNAVRLMGCPPGVHYSANRLTQVSGHIASLFGAVDEFEELVVGHDIAVARLIFRKASQC